MLKKLFGWGQKPQQEEEAPPAQKPAAQVDFGPALDFHGLLVEIEKMVAGTKKTFLVVAIPSHRSQVESLNSAVGVGGSHKADWTLTTITVVKGS